MRTKRAILGAIVTAALLITAMPALGVAVGAATPHQAAASPTPGPTVGQPARVAISTTVTLRPVGRNKAAGLVVLLYVGYSNKTGLIVTALHLAPMSRHAAAVRRGPCTAPGPVMAIFPTIKAGRDGRGATHTFVAGNVTKSKLSVTIYDGPGGTASPVLACGALP